MKDGADTGTPICSVPQDSSNKFGCSKVILEHQFYHSSAYEKTEKVTRTELIEKFLAAGNSSMTVTFDKKIDQDYLETVLSSVTKAQFDNDT